MDNRIFLTYIILAVSITGFVDTVRCYTCRGVCYKGVPCNCHTGMCKGDHCFSQGSNIDNEMLLIEKGCAKNPFIFTSGCEYHTTPDRTLCICNGSSFCNQALYAGQSSPVQYPSICHECNGMLNCPKSCRADYCTLNMPEKQQRCGFGMPVLPFHYQTKKLLPQPTVEGDKSDTCATFDYGDFVRFTQCICNGTFCNSGSLMFEDPLSRIGRQYVRCYTCRHFSNSGLVSNICHNGSCIGDFCVIKVENSNLSKVSHVHLAGCMNSSRPHLVGHGCSHRWVMNVKEELQCVCRSNFCNANIAMANYGKSAKRLQNSALLLSSILPHVIYYHVHKS
ncbi:hypothetical protein T4B_13513 [Trichinella pseudospiralis]|uniref:Uncharacterized protein n=1 Tax=Trichinella pseudospiralis TaxID=6337 RepID=A0A0V0YI32_TRIPS|nr:hypothetical protein T4E_7342 [Trichinella pseudospiralis]KRZ28899.1 hypothetical protein T4B_13513 [Trichinella pseudospiralis]KRZ37115.1 hypothetical protein T4C_13213 [Trichinella pseudospiralis]